MTDIHCKLCGNYLCGNKNCVDCYEKSLADTRFSKFYIQEGIDPWTIPKNDSQSYHFKCRKCNNILNISVNTLDFEKLICNECIRDVASPTTSI
jgi:hypothetical protein